MPRTSITFERGFFPSAAPVGPNRVPNSARDGQNVLFLGEGIVKSAKGLGPGPNIPSGQRVYLVGSKIGVVDGVGSVVSYTRDTFFWVSDAQVNVDGLLLPATGGALKFYFNNQVYNAGLPAPDAPMLSAGPAGQNSGTFSIVITRKRSFTNGESNPSPKVKITVNGKQITITFPSVPAVSDPNYHDMWGIYSTFANDSTEGSLRFLRDVSSSLQSVTLEWGDDDLASLNPPTDHNPPPPAKFVIAIGGQLILIGTFGGPNTGVFAGVSSSLPNQPDSYPSLLTTYLNPQETPIGLAGGAEGEYFIWTKNSLQSLLAAGDGLVQVRPIWSKLGIQGPHGGAFCNSEFYCFTGKAGPTRLGAGFQPDTTFARPVREWIRQQGWNSANVVVGHDPVYDSAVFMHGNIALPYMRSEDRWSCPIVLNATGTAKAALTFEGSLLVGVGSGLYEWETGTLEQPWYVIPSWQEAPRSGDRITITGYCVACDLGSSTLTTDLLLDFSNTPVAGASITDSQSGPRYTNWTHINKRCRNFTFKHSGMGRDHYIHNTEVEFLYPGAIREKK
ncbi:MAG: hypothetical protein AB1489_12050 [Acidobacteriota bacterium]